MIDVQYNPTVMKALNEGYTIDQIKEYAVQRWEQAQRDGYSRAEANDDMLKTFGLRPGINNNDVDKADFLASLLFEPFENPQEQKAPVITNVQQNQAPQQTQQQVHPNTEQQVSSDIVRQINQDNPNVLPNAKQPANWFEMLLSGYENSTAGLYSRKSLPGFTAPGPNDYAHTALYTVGQFIGDLPTNVLGGVLGATAGTAAGGPAGSAVGLMAGAGFVTEYAREMLLQSYKRGEASSIGDMFWRAGQALSAGGKGATIGMLTGAVAGGTANTLSKQFADAGIKGFGAKAGVAAGTFAAEAATMAGAGALLDYRLPTAQDFIHGGIGLLGLKASIGSGKVLQHAWVKNGITPNNVKEIFKDYPGLAQKLVTESSVPFGDVSRSVFWVDHPKSNKFYFDRLEAEQKALFLVMDDKANGPKYRQAYEDAKAAHAAAYDADVEARTKYRDLDYGISNLKSLFESRENPHILKLIKDEYGKDLSDSAAFQEFYKAYKERNAEAIKIFDRISDLRNPDNNVPNAYEGNFTDNRKGRKTAQPTTEEQARLFSSKSFDIERLNDLDYNFYMDEFTNRGNALAETVYTGDKLRQAEQALIDARKNLPPDPSITPDRTVSDYLKSYLIPKHMPVINIDALGSGAARIFLEKYAAHPLSANDTLLAEYRAAPKKTPTVITKAFNKLYAEVPDSFVQFMHEGSYTIPEIKKLLGDSAPREFLNAKTGDTPQILGGAEILKDKNATYKMFFGGMSVLSDKSFILATEKALSKEQLYKEPTISEARENVSKALSTKPEKPTPRELWNSFYRHVFDRFTALNKGAEYGTNTNAYVKARMSVSAADKATSFMETGTFGLNGQQLGKTPRRSLMDTFQSVPDLQKLVEYIAAHDTVNRHVKNKQVIINPSDALVLVKDLQKSENAAYAKAIEDINQYNLDLLQYGREAGLFAAKDITEFKKSGSITPISRLLKTIENEILADGDLLTLAQKAGLDPAKAREWKRAVEKLQKSNKGSEQLINPLETLIINTHLIHKAAAVNQAKKAIAENYGHSNVRKDLKDTAIAYAENSSEKLTSVTFKDEGKNKTFWVQKDIFEAVQALDEQSAFTSAKIFTALTEPTKWLRAGTALDPVFTIKSLITDQFAAGIQSKTGYRPFLDIPSAVGLLLKGRYSRDFNSLWERFRRAGGTSGTLVGNDRNRAIETLEHLSKRPFRNVIKNPREWGNTISYLVNPLNTIKSFYRSLQNFSEMVELAPRIKEFDNALKQGYTDEQAAFLARNVTLDYSRAGASTRAWNSISAFFNAGLQGFDKAFRTAKENPMGFMAAVSAYVVMPTLFLAAVDADIIYNNPDSDYAFQSRQRQPWHRAAFWCFPAGDNYSTPLYIPKPRGLFALFTYPFEAFVHEMALNRRFNLMDALKDSGFVEVMGEVSPVKATSFIPTGLAPALEIYGNRSFFTGNKIVPSNLERLVPEEQYTQSTSMLGKTIARTLSVIDKAFGGIWISDKLKSPINVDHLIGSWGGSLAKNALRTIDLAGDLSGQSERVPVEKDWTEYPVARAFFMRYPQYNPYQLAQFREKYYTYQRNIATVRHLLTQGNATMAQRAQAMMAEQPMIKLTKINSAISNQIALIHRIQNTDGLTSQEKRQYIDQIILSYIRTAEIGLQLANQFEALWERVGDGK